MTQTPQQPGSPDPFDADVSGEKMQNAELVTVAERPNEIAATVLVNVLEDEGIRAIAVGGFTSGFRAEAPGWVQVKTFREDADRARQVIAEIEPAE